MTSISPLPSNLISRFQTWNDTGFQPNESLFTDLVENGQHPQTMIISCCDSRVNVTEIFNAAPGDFFIHRNIANIVPPYDLDSENHGTAAAVEYGVTALGVKHLIILGHSQCGGVKGCHDMCSGNAPLLEKKTSFVGRWIESIRPAFEAVLAKGGSKEDQIHALERESILNSIDNLMEFPFVKERVENNELALHGAHIDIEKGVLEQFNPASRKFEKV